MPDQKENAATELKIWVDADACPVPVREILTKAALRTKTHVTFVANQSLNIRRNDFVQTMRVEKGFDVADNEIVKRIKAGDLLVSSDIPLADEAIGLGAIVINFRGEKLTKENIKQRLNMRDFFDTLRASGVQTGKTAAYSDSDKQAFANQLDRILAKQRN